MRPFLRTGTVPLAGAMEAAAPVTSASHPKLPPRSLLLAFLSKAGVSRCLYPYTSLRPHVCPRTPPRQVRDSWAAAACAMMSYGDPPGVLRSAQTLGITGSEPGNYFQGSNPSLLRPWPKSSPTPNLPADRFENRGLRVPATRSPAQPSVPADRHSKPGDGFSLNIS